MNKQLVILIIVIITLSVLSFQAIRKIKYQEYVLDLQEQGYSKTWAIHKASVEYKYIEADELYQAIQED